MVSDDEEKVQKIFTQATEELRNIYRLKTSDRVVPYKTKGESVEAWRRRVVVHKGRVLGVVDYCNNENQLFLRGLAIDPNYRRRGYAKELLGSLEETAKSLGLSGVSLTTIQETGNVNFFIHLGYEMVKRNISVKYERVDMEAPATEVDMMKQL
jgi:N-acetylglutamate synthase-like GNAT family acetyltransferase